MSKVEIATMVGLALAGTAIIATSISQRNLAESRVRPLAQVNWDSLPLQWTLTIKHGDGRRRIALFSDPNCRYCRKLEADLAKIGDVTVHLFLYPVVAPDSERQTKSVWCSSDPPGAWMELMFKSIEPRASPDCDTPIEKILALGRQVGARATPTWILPSGEIRSGALPREQLLRLLDAPPAAKR
jgi:thiol:disulfide interchange protein DsbC